MSYSWTRLFLDEVGRVGRILSLPIRQSSHDYHHVYERLLARLQEQCDLPKSSWKVLELGPGYTYPVGLLMSNQGIEYTGIDTLRIFWRDGRRWRYKERLLSGRSRLSALGSAFVVWPFELLYYHRLQKLAGNELRHKTVRLITYNGDTLPFPDGVFNIAVSNAVLEHISDLDRVISETYRVLEPGGVVDMVWHNWYSWSGNHFPDSVNRRYPWGHLTGHLEPPAKLGLNRKSPEDILTSFKRFFDVVSVVPMDPEHRLLSEDGFIWEGEKYLQDELAAALSVFPREWLLSKSYLVQAQKTS